MQQKKIKNVSKESSTPNSFIFGLFVNFLKPSAFLDSITEIELDKLKQQGIKMIICDLDNTLVPHFTKFPTKNAIKFVNEAKEKGFEFVLLSNNTHKRVAFFSEKLGLTKFIANAKKPFPRKMKAAINKYGYKPQEVVVIGDLIISDILASNLLNTESILVKPLMDSDVGWNRFLQWVEEKVFARLSKNNLLVSSDIEKKKILSEDYEIL